MESKTKYLKVLNHNAVDFVYDQICRVPKAKVINMDGSPYKKYQDLQRDRNYMFVTDGDGIIRFETENCLSKYSTIQEFFDVDNFVNSIAMDVITSNLYTSDDEVCVCIPKGKKKISEYSQGGKIYIEFADDPNYIDLDVVKSIPDDIMNIYKKLLELAIYCWTKPIDIKGHYIYLVTNKGIDIINCGHNDHHIIFPNIEMADRVKNIVGGENIIKLYKFYEKNAMIL